MDNRAIGVFDSGLGGLTAFRELEKRIGSEHIIYFGDTGRVPYGTKSKSTICRYTEQDAAFLLKKGVKMIIVACGTASSVASEVIKALPVLTLGVVEPAAKAAYRATENGKIGVIGTEATVRSGSFERELLKLDKSLEIHSAACSVFVPLVEAGWISPDDGITVKTAERYLEPIKEKGVDTLILGCTHFPIISEIIQRVMGDGVRIISSGAAAADEAVRLLRERDMLCKAESEKNGQKEFYVSDNAESFSRIAGIFLGRDDAAQRVVKISIEDY
ncbi:MAG: glutamate racemase [Acutalibacteraceae bacterium]